MKNLIKQLPMIFLLTVFVFNTSNASITFFNSYTAKDIAYSPDSVYDDDMLVLGSIIRFQSQVTADLIGASQELVFSGETKGNLDWFSRHITVIGPVGGSFRGLAQTIDVNAPVGRNILAFAQYITIGPSAEISHNANLLAAEVVFEGKINNKLVIKAGKVSIAGKVNGDLDIEAEEIEIQPNTIVEGDFYYKTPEEIKLKSGAIIKGEKHWTEQEKKIEKKKYKAFGAITFMLKMFLILNFIYSLIVFIIALIPGNTAMIPLMLLALIVSGAVVISLNKQRAIKAMTVMGKRFFVALGLGFILLLLFPLAAGLAILTIIGIPLGLIIVFAFGISCFVGSIYTAQFVGTNVGRLINIRREPPSFICLVLGIIVLAAISLIPVIGWIVVLLTLMLGLGALVLSLERFIGKVAADAVSKPSVE
jgi:cytoskeletal protein CcmA (bactofilin family)